MELSFQTFTPEEVTLPLLQRLLAGRMYEATYAGSLFKALYQESLQAQTVQKEVTLLIASDADSDQMVGVAMFEWRPPETFPLALRESQFAKISPVTKTLDKSFKLQGWFQVYVAPAQRQQGVARQMARALEDLIVSSPRFSLAPHEIPLMIAKGNALEVVKRSMAFHYPLREALPYSNSAIDFHCLTHQYIQDVLDRTRCFLNPTLENYQMTRVAAPAPQQKKASSLR